MTLAEFKDLVERCVHQVKSQGKDPEDIRMAIEIKTVGHIGGTPSVGVENLWVGFDWDSGKCIINPSNNLIKISDDDLKELRRDYDQEYWERRLNKDE